MFSSWTFLEPFRKLPRSCFGVSVLNFVWNLAGPVLGNLGTRLSAEHPLPIFPGTRPEPLLKWTCPEPPPLAETKAFCCPRRKWKGEKAREPKTALSFSRFEFGEGIGLQIGTWSNRQGKERSGWRVEAASYRHGLGLSKTGISNYSPTKQVDLWTLPLQQDFNFALHSWGSGMDRWLFSVLFCHTLAGKNSSAPILIWVCCRLPVFVRSWAPRGWMNLAIPKSVSLEGCSRRNTKGCPLNRSRLGFWRILSFVLSVRAFPTAWMTCFQFLSQIPWSMQCNELAGCL